jgi:PhnB protein
MEIQPYLFFNGRCEEAIEFYKQALGAEVEMAMRFKESPEGMPPNLPAGHADKIMHASIRVQDAPILMSDAMGEESKFEGFSLVINASDKATAERWFKALSAGGEVTMPLAKTFWSPLFGMLTDRFGVGWMVSVTAE